MTENEVATVVVDCAIVVHKALGPGLLENVYEIATAHEIAKRGLNVEGQRAVDVFYDGIRFEGAFRADMIVEHSVIVELKAIEQVLPKHKAQLLTYLRLTKLKLGLLLNFNEELMKQGIHRVVNNLPNS